MSYAAEFATVDAILASGARTFGVDSFALSVIKAERQMRKLFTFLVYQAPAFQPTDIFALRRALADNRNVYFEGFITGWDVLYPRSISSLIGRDYARLLARLTEATRHRNKIFHGQLTNQSLTRDQLLAYVSDIRDWCSVLAHNAELEVGYDGFGWNSFRKSQRLDLGTRHQVPLTSLTDYERFINVHMER